MFGLSSQGPEILRFIASVQVICKRGSENEKLVFRNYNTKQPQISIISIFIGITALPGEIEIFIMSTIICQGIQIYTNVRKKSLLHHVKQNQYYQVDFHIEWKCFILSMNVYIKYESNMLINLLINPIISCWEHVP